MCPPMNEPFIIDDEEPSAPQIDGVNLTGWDRVIFELEDDDG